MKMGIQTLQEHQLQSVLERARQSPRRRANLNLHQPDDSLQRMINAMLVGTYCQPHLHANPDKLEIFTVLSGEAAVITFDAAGQILEYAHLQEHGPVRQVEIFPRTWHTVLALSEAAILYEVIEGRYDPATHKKFASFAPSESSPEAAAYLKNLETQIRSRIAPKTSLDGIRLA
jgi:cupin fold WbuC family metalloprotein